MSKTYTKLMSELMTADMDVPTLATEAANKLDAELNKIFPDNKIKISVKYSNNLTRSIVVTVYAENKVTNVTRHNSSAHVQIFTFLGDSGVPKQLSSESNTQTGVKFRKMRSKDFDDYVKKMASWFKKNRQAFIDGIDNSR